MIIRNITTCIHQIIQFKKKQTNKKTFIKLKQKNQHFDVNKQTLRLRHNVRKSIAEDDEEASLPSDCINFLDAKPSVFGSEEMLPEPELEIWARTETSIGLG